MTLSARQFHPTLTHQCLKATITFWIDQLFNKLIDSSKLRGLPDFQRAVAAAVDRVNRTISATEKVRRTILADAQFTVENEQMTPSMKIRRHVIRDLYGDRLNALYK